MNIGEAAYSDSGVLSNPLSFVRSGRYSNAANSLDSRGSYGYLWSSRSYNTSISSYFRLYSSGLGMNNGNPRNYGFAVRCESTSKSFTTLINTSYSMKKNAETTEDNRDSGVLSGPLSFLHSGNFYWSGAYLYNRGEYGYYWLSSSYSAVYANYLRFDSTNLNPQGIDPRGYGFAVRCVQILHHSH